MFKSIVSFSGDQKFGVYCESSSVPVSAPQTSYDPQLVR